MADNLKGTKELTTILWECADILRSKMSANQYMDYILPILFYKFLSDKTLARVNKLISYEEYPTLEEKLDAYEHVFEESPETWKEVKDLVQAESRYILEPKYTYTYLINAIKNNSFERTMLESAFKYIEACDQMFEGLFSGVDLYSTALGLTASQQASTVINLLEKINEANLLEYSGDAIGDAYEYMIGQFASETGKKAGEFYTPKAVSEILTRIAIKGQEDKKGLSVYDPAMGSASLLLDAKKYSKYPALVKHYGQEIMPTTYNLARMNMFLHDIAPENQRLRNGDTLDADWPTSEENVFDMVVMNPPYAHNWKASEGFKTDPRFSDYDGNLAPKSKADYAFLLHGYYHLKNTGTMGIVLPHGVLFRGSSESKIRQILCEKGAIYAIIGLPANLFHNTGIPTIIMILKKKREDLSRDILFIDASKDFEKVKTQNVLKPEHIDAILELYTNRKDVDKKAHLASFEEIQKNDFNLNIPRYVDSSEEVEEINIGEVITSIKEIDSEIAKLNNEVYMNLQELTSEDKDLLSQISELASLFKASK